MSEDVKKVQTKLESTCASQQPQIEEKALALHKQSSEEAIQFLNDYTNSLVKEGMAEWKSLGEYLMVKYVDGVIKPEVNGEFKRNQHGQPASPIRPGYSNEYYQKIIDQTGDKYKVIPVE